MVIRLSFKELLAKNSVTRPLKYIVVDLLTGDALPHAGVIFVGNIVPLAISPVNSAFL